MPISARAQRRDLWKEARLPDPLLAVGSLRTGYGATQILRGVDLTVGAGEIVAVLGSNGTGKSTFNRTLSGVQRPWQGTIRFADSSFERSSPAVIVGLGLVHL